MYYHYLGEAGPFYTRTGEGAGAHEQVSVGAARSQVSWLGMMLMMEAQAHARGRYPVSSHSGHRAA